LIAKRAQLGLQVWGGLRGKIRKRRRGAATTDAMTVCAGDFGQLVSRVPELGRNVGSHSAARQRAGSQELIASMLGVRRTGVTEAAGKLKDLGVISYRRGHITVLVRSLLNVHVCERCDGVKREYTLACSSTCSIARTLPPL
jgi:CRP-like cAMP-binding protein